MREKLSTHSIQTVDTRRLLEHVATVKALGPQVIRGLEHPVDVYTLVAADPQNALSSQQEPSFESPFIGRRQEHEQLREALRQAREGGGQLVAVSGHAGVGKSRLVEEFLAGVDRSECSVWRSHAGPFDSVNIETHSP